MYEQLIDFWANWLTSIVKYCLNTYLFFNEYFWLMNSYFGASVTFSHVVLLSFVSCSY